MAGDRAGEMSEFTQRTRLLLGDGVERLAAASVAVFGLGGVGSFAAEALARAGIGRLVLIDGDVVSDSNRNRQLPALVSTVGQAKTAVMAARIADINPACRVETRREMYRPTEREYLRRLGVDYVIDAIDDVPAKVGLAVEAQLAGIPLVAALGTGNKLQPELLETADIYETSVCPLARVLRRELRQAGVRALRVVYSREEPCRPVFAPGEERVPGSVSFVPPVAGMLLAGEVIRALAAVNKKG